MASPSPVPLWTKSNYSFLEGASHPEELVAEAARLGLRSLALTDRDGVYGAVRAHVAAAEHGVGLIIGAEMTIADGTRDDGARLRLLAMSRKGYGNLCSLISDGRLRSPKGECRVGWDEVCAHAGGLIALVGVDSLDGGVESLRDAFGDRLYALVVRHRQSGDLLRERRLRAWADAREVPVVAGTEVLYHTPSRQGLQDVVTCLRHGVTLATAGRRLRPNAEHALRSPIGFERLFADDPAAIRRTEEIADRCAFSFSEIRYRYPSERLPDGTTSAERLRTLTLAGARERYPGGVPPDVRDQLEKELALIGELEYDGYFLTMWEIVQFCRRNGILCQGRGSAANSAVCYCLGVTAVDPVRMRLLFERFISRERGEPPDIDLDIEHNRREEVIQYVYERYGRDHAAMVANVVRYRARSAVREVGKVLGIPETDLDRIARQLSHFETLTPEKARTIGLDPDRPAHEHLVRLMLEIQDVPRHLSIHPGGFLLGHEPVRGLVPIENATMPGRTVIQWDKDDLEDLGLFKVDLLGLGALHVVHLATDLIREHGGEDLTMATIPPADPLTFEMIQRADTVGVFQVESRAQMAMLPRLRPRTYYDLVIEVSIVRPGPITGGMVHPFLRRRNGEEAVDYVHPSLEPVLEKTLGVPIFQEQVMQIAIVAADYSPGEADQLRRDMAAWRRSGRIERHRERIITRMQTKGISREFAERVFDQIRGFGEYGFPESHAASFALIAYATAWLKRHHPAAFLCALLNAQPMGFYAPATLIDDAKRHGIDVRPVDVQHSRRACTLERCARSSPSASPSRSPLRSPSSSPMRSSPSSPGSGEGFAVRIGLDYVKGLTAADADRIVAARGEGPFRSIADLAARARLEAAVTARLAGAGALESLGRERRRALWDALAVRGAAAPELGADATRDASATVDSSSTEWEGDATFVPLTGFETISWDYQTMNHSARGHPLAGLRDELSAQGLPDAAAVRALPDGRRTRYAGVVVCRQQPGTAGGVVFMTLEDETGFVNVVLWQKVVERHRLLVRTASFIGVTGKMQVESGVVHLIAETLWAPRVRRPASAGSRDFH